MFPRNFLLVLFASLIHLTVFAQVPAVRNTAFAEGEHLTYQINFYSFITGSVPAGNFELIVAGEKTSINNQNTFHCIARGRTQWAFDFFYTVNDRFESFIDESTLLPLLALRRIQETDYIRNQDLVFDHSNHKATFKDNIKGITRVISTSSTTLDLLSAVYYLRAMELPTADQTRDVQISYIFSDSLRNATIKFLGTETVQTAHGKVNCIKVQPQVIKGSVFKATYPLTVWISNDKNRIPVLVESEIVMGKVRVELVSWAGLLNPFSALITQKQTKK